MGDGYMCGRNVKMKESLSHFCGISFLPKWDFFFCGLHISQQYIDELRKFVNIGPAHEIAEFGFSRIIEGSL